MKVSANELTGLAAKAARGAGAPPAQAAAFGRAALCHLIANRPMDDLVSALDALPQGPILDLPLALLQGGAVATTAPLGLMHSYADAHPFTTTIEDRDGSFALRIDRATPTPRRCVTRVSLPDKLATLLTAHGEKTLVPESAASRSSGAGAGLTDND